jgi:hypothetical protein
MVTDRDVTRIVQSWLRTDENESADRVLDNVLALLDATPQRRSWWPARRSADMNTFAKLAIAAAAVVVVAIIGINLLPARGGVGGGPAVSPSPTPSLAPSPTPTPQPSPSASAVAFPPEGPLAIGRHSLIRGGIPFSLSVPTSGWHSEQGYFIEKDPVATPDGASFLFWDPSALGIFADPCTQQPGPTVGPSTADLAAAVSTLSGTDLVSGPSDVTVGGRPAKHVVITVPEDAPCAAGEQGFHLWFADLAQGEARYATALGETVRVWIVDVDGTRLFIEAESYKGAGPEVEQEIQQIVDSIQFE